MKKPFPTFGNGNGRLVFPGMVGNGNSRSPLFPGGGVPCRVPVRGPYRVPVRVIGGIPGWVQVGFQRWGGESIQGFREGSKGDSREGSRVG